jgi:hypothetical protein
MVASKAAGGLVFNLNCDQVVPVQSQVSFRYDPPEVDPPNRRSWPVAGSYAIGAPARADGLFAVVSCVQTLPFHSHVSFAAASPVVAPPNRII